MKTLRWIIPFAMLSGILAGCGSGGGDDAAPANLPPAQTSADQTKPASSTNAGTQTPAVPQ
jgi:predicted small lipoprotein YifL